MSRALPYPADIRVLTSLRYFAAAWVVLFHFSNFLGTRALTSFPPVAFGYLGVDFFFVLSGFVLTHVYQPQIDAGRFDYWAFVAKRFGRIYPMHIVMLAVFVGIGLAARWGSLELEPFISGVSLRSVEPALIFRGFVANVTLIHAWGATPWLMFNQPSWSISAEWFAYLLFPALVIFRRSLPGSEGVRLLLVAVLFLALSLAVQFGLHGQLTRLTWNVGILRIFPEFLLGMSLHRVGETWSAGARGALVGLAASLTVCLGAMFLTLALPHFSIPLATVVVLGLAGIVLFAADADRHGRLRPLKAAFPVLLGEISYSVYMVHLAIGILAFDVVAPRYRPDDLLGAGATLVGLFTLVTLVSWGSYRAIEVPGRALIVRQARRLSPAATLGSRHGP